MPDYNHGDGLFRFYDDKIATSIVQSFQSKTFQSCEKINTLKASNVSTYIDLLFQNYS